MSGLFPDAPVPAPPYRVRDADPPGDTMLNVTIGVDGDTEHRPVTIRAMFLAGAGADEAVDGDGRPCRGWWLPDEDPGNPLLVMPDDQWSPAL